MANFIFDLDETLVGGDLVAIISTSLFKNKVLDKVYTNIDVSRYNLDGLPELLKDRVNDAFNDPKFVWYKHPLPAVNYFLKSLISDNNNLGIITARPDNIKEETLRFLKARFYNIDFSLGIYFTSDKEQILKSIKPDYYFDDNVFHCIRAKTLGVTTYLISNKHTPWNHEFAREQLKVINPVKVLRNVAFFSEMSVY